MVEDGGTIHFHLGPVAMGWVEGWGSEIVHCSGGALAGYRVLYQDLTELGWRSYGFVGLDLG